MHNSADGFRATYRRELKNERSQTFLSLLSFGGPLMRKLGMASFPDPDAAQAYAHAIRAQAVERMPELLQEFEKNATARGAKVIWAADAAEANAAILEIAKQRGIEYITKGKSKITEEMGLNEYFSAHGVEVLETDLGEVITQMLSLPPFHSVGASLNIPAEDISDIFLKKGIIKEPTTDPVELGKAARRHLREKFRHVNMGIVGVNMAVAATGTIINVENEGNIRMIKSSPKTLVAVMSIEKVVPGMEDALHMVRMLCRNCTGQKLSSYVSMDTGPKHADELDGPEELFIVILDNGRSAIYADPKIRQILRCIRCGACLNCCPVYGKIGGYPYGYPYCGPMGQILTPQMLGLESTSDLYRACTLCGTCKEICPAGIDQPSLLLEYRARELELRRKGKKALLPTIEHVLAWLVALGMSSGPLWRLGVKCARPLLNSQARDGYISGIPIGPRGWFLCRDLPAMPRKAFNELWPELQNQSDTATYYPGRARS